MAELLHEALPRLRKLHGLSQSDLAAATEPAVSVGTIQTYENPKKAGRVPDAEILEALAAGLGENPAVFHEYPIALARRAARPSVTQRARKAAQRLDDTPSTSPRTRRAQGDGGAGR